MYILRDIKQFVVPDEATIREHLNKSLKAQERVMCVVDSSNRLVGVVSAGDILRWLHSQSGVVDLDRPITQVVNRQHVSAGIDDPPHTLQERFRQSIDMVPMLDQQGILRAIAVSRNRPIRIGQALIADDQPVFIIAEIGNNHNGCLDRAFQLIDAAVAAGANCAKFQMRDMRSLYRNRGNPDDPAEDLGSQYVLDVLAQFSLARDHLFQAFDYAASRGILALCTPWDLTSVAELQSYGMPAFKIASADMTNHDLLETVIETAKPLIVSTGMSSEEEIKRTAALLRRYGAQSILLHCNATYPTPFKDVNLNYLNRLRMIADGPVGYSGHERGYAVAVAAVTLGARVIEKHITLDRTLQGNDHKVSLLPDEFGDMVRAIRNVEEALGTDDCRSMTQGERINRSSLAKSLVATRDIPAGTDIRDDMITAKSPGQGLQPMYRDQLIGTRLRRTVRAGGFFFESDLSAEAPEARPFHFSRPWGLPVRYHDARALFERSNPDLLEFHLSYKDMEIDPRTFLDEPLPVRLLVHAPELFAGDHVLDICSLDPGYRARSLEELQRVIDVTRGLRRFFPGTPRPAIVVNVGGFSDHSFLKPTERERRYALLADGLDGIDAEGVELLPQTMPPFPWHYGGQRFHNLFVSAEDLVRFGSNLGLRYCLDVSHSRLACTHFGWSFEQFLDLASPHVAHLHIADARGVDGEGLQIGDGTIDFVMLGRKLKECCPNAGFIPEVWQGHTNGGEGFWYALAKLEPVL